MTLTQWQPVGELASVEVDLLNRMFGAFAPDVARWVPAVDVYESATKDIVIKADLPEMKREDIKVTFENDVLTLEGERKVDPAPAQSAFARLERGSGAFRRTVALPQTVDATRVAASYQDGVLTVTLPRREESRPRQIQING